MIIIGGGEDEWYLPNRRVRKMNIKKLIPVHGGGTDSDALAFFSRRAAAGDPVPSSDKIHWSNLFSALKSTMGVDGVTSIFNSLDVLKIETTYSKAAALVNVIGSSYNGTITNDYGGSFTQYLGLKGNGTNFVVNTGYNPFDGGTYKYKTNDACCGVLVLSDAAETGIDLSGLNSAGTAGTYIRSRTISATGYDFGNMINGPQNLTTNVTTPYAYGWYDVRKNAALSSEEYMNGYLVVTSSGLANNTTGTTEWVEFAGFTTVATLWCTRTHGAWYAGSSNIMPNVLHGLIYKYLLKPLGINQAKVGKRILCIGDSMTGDAGAPSSLSAISEYPRRIVSQLNATPSGWIVAQNGVASRTLATINGILATRVSPFRNTNLDKDIVVLFAMTNDLASGTPTAAAAKALYDTFTTTLTALGFKVIVVGVIDRNATFSGGQNQAGFDTVRAQLRTLMLAAYPTATGVTNVTTDGTNYYIDTISNSKFADATDTTYFNADTIHLNTTGYDALADELITPTIQLI